MRWTTFGSLSLSGVVVLAVAMSAPGASNLSDPLTSYTGNSSQAGTQAALGAAGFNFFSTQGASFSNNDNGTPDDPSDDFMEQSGDDSVVFDASGAHFGSLWPGDGGRNYMRTVQSDFVATSFVAEVTFSVTDLATQQVFFGLGAGDRALFGLPDWSTLFSSASFWIETTKIVSFRTNDDTPVFVDTNFGPGPLADLAGAGTHRLQMSFNSANNQLRGAIDIDYAGGPFAADVQTTFPIVTNALFGATGWPGEPARIFIGGDDGAIFRDFSVVIPEPASFAVVCLGLMVGGAFGRVKR